MELHSHVAALSFLTSSHAAPLLSLIRHLAAHSPATYFSFFNIASCNSTILSPFNKSQIPLPSNLRVYDVWDGVPEGYVFSGKFQEDFDLFLSTAKDTFHKSMKLAAEERGRRFTSLVTDAFLWFGGEIAEELGGVPWIPFWTAGLNSLAAHVHTEALRGSTDGSKAEDVLMNIPGLEKARVSDLPEGVVFGNLNSMFSEMLRKMGREILRADAVVVNSFDELQVQCMNGLKAKFKALLNVGPLDMVFPPAEQEDKYGCLHWLNDKTPNSVVYISFGTVVKPQAQEILSLAEALEDRRVTFLWAMKESEMAKLPEGFAERTEGIGKVVTWAPQKRVLSHDSVGIFITHCGWNSIMEGVAGNVAMICRPFFGDQRLNARAAEEVWGIGVQVRGGTLTKKGALECLEKTSDPALWQGMRAAGEALREAAERAAGEGGASRECFGVLVRMVTRGGNVDTVQKPCKDALPIEMGIELETM